MKRCIYVPPWTRREVVGVVGSAGPWSQNPPESASWLWSGLGNKSLFEIAAVFFSIKTDHDRCPQRLNLTIKEAEQCLRVDSMLPILVEPN